MSTISIDAVDDGSKARRQVESHCQSLVNAGIARWHVNDDGDTELHLGSGEAYRFDESGVTRLK